MSVINKFLEKVTDAFEFNQATLSGSLDIIVIEHEDGTMTCTPFHVRFGKLRILKPKDCKIRVTINNRPTEVYMKLGSAGEGYFESEPETDQGPNSREIQEMVPKFRNKNKTEQEAVSGDDQLEEEGQDILISSKGSLSWEWGKLPERKRSTTRISLDRKRKNMRESKISALGGDHLTIDSPSVRGGDTDEFAFKGTMSRATTEDNESGQPSIKLTGIAGESDTHGEEVKIGEDEFNGDLPVVTEEDESRLSPKKEKNYLELRPKGDLVGVVSASSSTKGGATDEIPIEDMATKRMGGFEELTVDINNAKDEDPFGASSWSESSEGETEIELSICGSSLKNAQDDVLEQIFESRKIDFDRFDRDPMSVINNPDLVVRIDDELYDYQTALPVIISFLAFGQSLSTSTMDKLAEGNKKKNWTDWFKKDNPNHGPIRRIPTHPATQRTRSLRATSEQLRAFKLNPGRNEIEFAVVSDLQGEQKVGANIYLWPSSSKIVVSDIDGTITRSDVLGHLMPMLGKDWSHEGVTELYTKIRNQGYRIMYLSSRPIGQATITREYLDNLKQNAQTLPEGPLILSPDRLVPAITREVIYKKPEVFKMACLEDIRSLFPVHLDPFHAGFGNKNTDAISYRAVGIPMENIFIINPKGDIDQLNVDSTQEGYKSLNKIIDQVFPSVASDAVTSRKPKLSYAEKIGEEAAPSSAQT
eukprot:CAMPEP_0115047002 /NCGR_PEP_ID=MMETSP0216-20121206/49063_1 /TAXON_ID=223996 /ORGANISM="Protocruzia adherens, Strain Boccale" /LENGTH=701 /DNA_ID=CAMNT_0002430147 /DNA_START=35 /DNA_END=2140 /DNA_ORIENTATION=-